VRERERGGERKREEERGREITVKLLCNFLGK